MNNKRRKRLREISKRLSDICGDIEDIKVEEENSMLNIPENLSCSEQYEKSETACYNLEEASNSIEDAIESINSSCE